MPCRIVRGDRDAPSTLTGPTPDTGMGPVLPAILSSSAVPERQDPSLDYCVADLVAVDEAEADALALPSGIQQ